MGTIVFAAPATDADYRRVVEADKESTNTSAVPLHEAEGSAVRRTIPGGPDALQLLDVRLDPDVTVSPHAHRLDEIVFVLEGALIFGARACGPGTSISIPAQTLYGFRSGPEGARFINFRASSDNDYVTKADFLARRTGATG